MPRKQLFFFFPLFRFCCFYPSLRLPARLYIYVCIYEGRRREELSIPSPAGFSLGGTRWTRGKKGRKGEEAEEEEEKENKLDSRSISGKTRPALFLLSSSSPLLYFPSSSLFFFFLSWQTQHTARLPHTLSSGRPVEQRTHSVRTQIDKNFQDRNNKPRSEKRARETISVYCGGRERTVRIGWPVPSAPNRPATVCFFTYIEARPPKKPPNPSSLRRLARRRRRLLSSELRESRSCGGGSKEARRGRASTHTPLPPFVRSPLGITKDL